MKARTSLKLHIVLIISINMVLSSFPSLAQSGDKLEWDILGIKLGQPLNEAKEVLKKSIPNIEFNVHTVTFNKSGFKTPESYLEVFGKNEFIIISQDASPEKRILSIQRIAVLAKPTSLDIILNALVEKYGDPINESSDGDFFWINKTSSKHYETEIVTPVLYDAIEEYWRMVGFFSTQDPDYIPYFILPEIIQNLDEFPFGGVALKASIFESNGIAERMELTLIDMAAFEAHIKLLAETLERGESEIRKKEKEKANQAEPPKL